MSPIPQRSSVIPVWAGLSAALTAAMSFIGLNIGLAYNDADRAEQIILPVLVAATAAGYLLLMGYIYGDAKRRGMRYVAWTFLAALAPSAIGIILYFILRSPIQVHCTRCGCGTAPGFAFCPRCGAPLSATCRQCNRAAEAGWSHCAWCGAAL